MAIVSDTASMIDYMTIRYGRHVRSSAIQRADLLAWLQAADQEIWLIAPWSWREIEASLTVSTGVTVYTLDDASYTDMLDLYNETGDQVQKMPERIFHRYYRNANALDVTGEPVRWGWLARDADGVPKFAVWPSPASTYTFKAVYVRNQVALEDAADNFTWIPPDYRIILPMKAIKMLAVHEGKVDLAAQMDQEIAGALSAMMQKDREHFEGRL